MRIKVVILGLLFISFFGVGNSFDKSDNKMSIQELEAILLMFQEVEEEKILSAIKTIKKLDGVIDASINHELDSICLILIVERNTSKVQTMKLGEKFVRLVKNLGHDLPPGEKIGCGFYDYFIEVHTFDKNILVRGNKSSLEEMIIWESG